MRWVKYIEFTQIKPVLYRAGYPSPGQLHGACPHQSSCLEWTVPPSSGSQIHTGGLASWYVQTHRRQRGPLQLSLQPGGKEYQIWPMDLPSKLTSWSIQRLSIWTSINLYWHPAVSTNMGDIAPPNRDNVSDWWVVDEVDVGESDFERNSLRGDELWAETFSASHRRMVLYHFDWFVRRVWPVTRRSHFDAGTTCGMTCDEQTLQPTENLSAKAIARYHIYRRKCSADNFMNHFSHATK